MLKVRRVEGGGCDIIVIMIAIISSIISLSPEWVKMFLFFSCPDVGAVTAPWPHVVMCREREKSDLGFLLLIWGRGKEGCVCGGGSLCDVP